MNENERIVCEFLRKIAPSREWRYLGEVEHYWIGELCDELNKQLKSENAKLRELLASTISNYVDGHMDDTGARYPCDLCDASSMQQCDYQQDKQCPFYRHLRELGVEVDE